MRVAFFGLPLAALLLDRDGVDLALAALPPLDAPGRRRLVRRLGDRVVCLSAERWGDFEAQVDRRFRRAPPDLVVSWYFTRKLPARWLVAPLGAIGAHPSLLPRHRGPDPFYWAIDSGDRETGVTIHSLTEAYDEGDVWMQERLPIGDRNAWQLARALDRPSLRLLRRAVGLAGSQRPEPVPQDESLATWAPAPSGDLLRVDFSWPTDRVLRRIRALSPVPGVPLEIRGARFFLTRAEPANAYPDALAPGEAAIQVDGVAIRTADGAVRLLRATMEDEEGAVTEMGAPEILAHVRAGGSPRT